MVPPSVAWFDPTSPLQILVKCSIRQMVLCFGRCFPEMIGISGADSLPAPNPYNEDHDRKTETRKRPTRNIGPRRIHHGSFWHSRAACPPVNGAANSILRHATGSFFPSSLRISPSEEISNHQRRKKCLPKVVSEGVPKRSSERGKGCCHSRAAPNLTGDSRGK